MTQEQAQSDKQAVRGELQLLKCAKRVEQFANARFHAGHRSTLVRFDVLANLYRAPGARLTTRALANRLLASQGNITRLLDRMQADGLVERAGDNDDRRVIIVHLTATGRAGFERMAADHEHWMGDVFGALESAEQQELIRLLGKLRERIDALERDA